MEWTHISICSPSRITGPVARLGAMRYLALPLALSLGCTARIGPLPTHYTVVIDSASDTPDNRILVSEAARNWMLAVNDPDELTVDLATVGTLCAEGDACIYFRPNADNGGDKEGWCSALSGGTARWDATSSITVDPTFGDADTTLHILEHELGHAFGLVHTGAATVMFSMVSPLAVQNVAAQDPTCSDAEQYVSLRGIPNRCTLPGPSLSTDAPATSAAPATPDAPERPDEPNKKPRYQLGSGAFLRLVAGGWARSVLVAGANTRLQRQKNGRAKYAKVGRLEA
jgi:hypothetical protein